MIEIKFHESGFDVCWWWKYIWRKIACFKENTESLVFVNKEMVLDVNADKKQCMDMSRDHNAEWSQNIDW